MNRRLRQLQSKIRKAGLDALLITKTANLAYLFGYSEEGCSALISKRAAFFLAPILYFPEIKAYLPGTRAVDNSRSSLDKILSSLKIKKAGFEAENLTVSQARQWRRVFGGSKFLPLNDFVEEFRLVKDSTEIDLLKQSLAIAARAYQRCKAIIKPGISETEVASLIDRSMREQGAEPAFKTIVAGGPGGACPHHLNTSRKLKNGEMVVLDFGANYRGYHSDLTRTVFLGKINHKFAHIYALVLKAQQQAIAQARPGASASDLDRAARSVITTGGMGKYFIHSTGHGVGLEIHEDPRLSRNEKRKLSAGMVITVEPGVYVPGWGGVRIEDMVLVTPRGGEVLSRKII